MIDYLPRTSVCRANMTDTTFLNKSFKATLNTAFMEA